MNVGSLRALTACLTLLLASVVACTGNEPPPPPPPDDPPEGSLPDVVVEPTRLDFGSVVVNETLTRPVQVANRGDEAVCITARELGGQAPQQYALTLPAGATDGVFCVGPGETTDLDVTFAPKLSGRLLAGLQLEVCDACDPLTVDLLGVGLASGLIVEPVTIDFGAVNPSACVSDFVTFENLGNTVRTIRQLEVYTLSEGQAPDPAFEILAEAPFSLEAGEVEEVEVTFCPEDLRLHLGKLHWTSSDARNGEGDVVLSGQGGGPDIELAPALLDFGRVALGVPGLRRVVVTNVGFEELVLQGFEIRGSAAFTLESPPSPVNLGVGELAEIVVRFAPTGESDETAQLLVSSNDADEPESALELRGTGVALGECVHEPLPSSLDFGIVERNRSKTLELGLTVSPASPGPCLVSALELTPGSDAAFTLPEGLGDGVILQPGETWRVPVGFLPPTHAARYQGAVRLYVSDLEHPEHVVQLTGSSQSAPLLVAPDDLDFGQVQVGCSTPTDRQFCVYGTGSTTLHLTGLALVESGAGGEFLFESVPPGLGASPPSVPVAPGGGVCFTMAYAPSDVGSDAAAVKVNLAEFEDPFVITLAGTGVDAAVQTDTFVQLDRPEADLLFVVGNTDSMADEQQTLSDNLGAFVGAATRQGIDYHLAVVSTDASDQGLFVPVDGSRERVVTPDLADPQGLFVQNLQLAVGSGSEQGLQTAYQALTDPNISAAERNGGFLRPGAHLAVVFISDGEDRSPAPVDFYLNFFLNVKRWREHLFTASAIVGGAPACSTSCGQAVGSGMRYRDLQQRSGGVFAEICTCDWSAALESLASLVFGHETRFFLRNVPEQPSQDAITVVIHRSDGTSYTAEPRLTEGGEGEWWYDAEDNSVVFDPAATPEPGDTVEISYSVQCCSG